MDELWDVAIVGGGYSGAVLALHLARRASPGSRFAIIEPRAELGSGLAYETRAEEHRINVPAERMGVGIQHADRFDTWLKAHHAELIGDAASENTYVARHWFGSFVRDRLAEAFAQSGSTLRHIRATAASAQALDSGTELTLSDKRLLRARNIVIAVSHGLPALPHGVSTSLLADAHFIENPWNIQQLKDIPADGSVLIIGTGLTMADVTASLLTRGHRGHITAVSRHGLLSRRAGPVAAPPDLDFSKWPPCSLTGFVKRLRAEIASAETAGFSWRGIFTALRQQSAHVWTSLSKDDQRRFLRHLKAFYDVHRYRMAPATYDVAEAAMACGQLDIVAARVIAVSASGNGFDVSLKRRASTSPEHRHFAAIVNCTGPKQHLRPDRGTFLGALIAAGLAKADPLGLGLAVDADFRLLGAARNLYALGPLTRERFGDTYGAPEIQLGAERLAGLLIAALKQEHSAAA